MAIEALAHEYNVAGRGEAETQGWFKRGAGKFFSLSLNEYGGTVPSLYELLPAPMECSPVQKASAENLRKRDAADGKPAVTDIGDVFHFQIWKNYGWPKNLIAEISARKKNSWAPSLRIIWLEQESYRVI